MPTTFPRLAVAAATTVLIVGLAVGAAAGSDQVLLAAGASVFATVVAWILVINDGGSPVGPAVAWCPNAIVVAALPAALGSAPWMTGLWPLNLAGLLALLLVFPDGWQEGRLWRVLPWTFLVSVACLELALWGAVESSGRISGVQPSQWRLAVGYAGMVVLGGTMIAAVASLVVRYRRGDVRVRHQIRWLLLACGAVVTLLIAGWVAEALGATVTAAYAPFLVAIVLLVPAAVGVAVVRYDLFDIDRILSESAAWFVTVIASALVFAAVVVIVGEAVSLQAGVSNTVAAFVVALVLLPLQRHLAHRVGRWIDRDRFVALSSIHQFAADIRSGRRTPEEVEAALRVAQDDPGLAVQVKTPSGAWARLDGAAVAQPSGLALEAGEEVVAMIALTHDTRRARRRLAELAKAAWVPIEVGRLQIGLRQALDDVRRSRHRLAVTTADERKRLERDLHDRAQQRIIASAVNLRLLQKRLSSHLAAELETTIDDLRGTVEELRRISHGLRPTLLDEGLGAALASIQEGCPIPLQLDVTTTLPEIGETRALAAYLVVNEAVVNVLKHAQASAVSVRVSAQGHQVTVEVTDNGVGGVAADAPLLALRDRVLSVGGALKVASRPGLGTTILAVI